MWLAVGFVACIGACACLALSQLRHWRTLGDRTSPPTALGIAGWVLLFAGLIACVVADGGSFAALMWPLMFASSAFLVAMALSYRPQLLLPLARVVRRSDKGDRGRER